MAERFSFEKKLIYLYIFFLIFEGALRKWGIPSFSQPIALVRDPIVLLLVIRGFRKGLLKKNGYVVISTMLSLVSMLISPFLDNTNLNIVYYGTRIFLLYFPAIFVVSKVLNEKDVYRIGRLFLYISIPMTFLVILQFFSPQNSFVNRGVGGDMEGAGFGGALGYYRPSALFSFTQGYACFQSFVCTYILLYFADKKAKIFAPIHKYVLIFAILCYIVSIPMSISRTHLFQTVAILIFYIVGLILSGREFNNLMQILKLAIITCVIIPIMLQIEYIQTMVDVFVARFTSAADSEGDVLESTIGNRYFGALIRPWTIDVPFWGHGVGMGTRLGLKFNPRGLITDEEGTRIVYESGFFLGSIYILLRYVLSFSLLGKTIRSALKKDNIPLLFLPCALFLLPQGSWGNSVPLGFCVLAVAFVMIMLKRF